MNSLVKRGLQTVLVQGVEVALIVEVNVQDRAVVFSGRDQDGRLAREEKVVRVLRMQADRRRGYNGSD